MKHRHLVVLIGVLMVAMGMARSVLADAGPKPPPDSESVAPGGYTEVQMESENVLLVVGNGVAYVQAYFRLRNQGTATETIDVQFPLGYGGSYELIEDFTVWIDGAVGDYVVEEDEHNNTWAVWKMTFVPGQLVNLGVGYTASSSHGCYEYILHTGAGWYGTIGEGTIIFRMPYEVDDFNTRFDERDSSPHPDYYTVSGTDVTWRFTDLEPTADDDICLCMMAPWVWQEIQTARQRVATNPDSADASLQLARILNQALIGFPEYSGRDERFSFIMIPISAADQNEAEEAVKSYKQSLEAASDAGIDDYVDYAALLLAMTDCSPPFHENLRPTVHHILEQEPNDRRFSGLLEECWLPTDGLEAYLSATFTPIPPTQTPGPTMTQLEPSMTSVPTLTSILTPTPTITAASPFHTNPPIGLWAAIGAVVVMGGVGIGVGVYRRKERPAEQ
ncbi:MAG: hypothetical protein JXB30_03500 [Anaerolineae bacterium]|nr:hypothetical protein [Anaerolineae bacterium]